MLKNRHLSNFLRSRAKASLHYKSKVLNALLKPKTQKVQRKKEK